MRTELIATVEDVFSLDDRGLVGTGIWLNEAQTLKPGTMVEIVKPDGSALRATLRGTSLFTKCFGQQRAIGLLFEQPTDKSELPLGSQVWLVNEK